MNTWDKKKSRIVKPKKKDIKKKFEGQKEKYYVLKLTRLNFLNML